MMNINKTLSQQSGNIPTILVVFGGTGDLAAKKIIPSLWHLFLQKRLPDRFSVISFSRRKISNQDFQKFVRDAVGKRGGLNINEEQFLRFFKAFVYNQGSFEDKDAFRSLAQTISETESVWGVCSNKLFYLAVPPVAYENIFKNLAGVSLNLPCGGDFGWSRVLIEKPLGTDRVSARKLQLLVSSFFKEEQIYRIDHYLFKEIIQGIENFRFSNNLFENTWDNTTIDRIHIRLYETIGVEERGRFYDAIGTLRDVGQNHLLTMLAAITMEYPPDMKADAIRENRAKILETLMPWTEKLIKKNTFRAQYSGYKDIEGVRTGSETETYFSVKTELTSPRWSGVPVIMEAGKRMAEARKEIVLTFKHPSTCLLCETGPHAPNMIVFRLEPNDEIVIHFWTKKPGFEKVLEERTFSFFLYEKETKIQYVEEYAKVIHAAMDGNQALFIAPREIDAMWKFIDPIIDSWKRNSVPLSEYKPDTTPLSSVVDSELADTHRKKKELMGKIGIIGLGKMGANLARQLHKKGWQVVGFNKTSEITKGLETEGIIGSYSLSEFVEKLAKPRIIWLMVPAGKPVDEIIFGSSTSLGANKDGIIHSLNKGDIIIDGGNSFYKDSIARYKKLKKLGIHFIDAGVSGGPKGALEGASIMVGGDKNIFKILEPLFCDLAAPNAYQFFEGAGLGHFVKMVHNGIEYGMMQSLAEGFATMKKYSSKLDLRRVANVYNHKSVIESRLVGWLEDAFVKYGKDLNGVSGSVSHTGEGEWTVKTAKELKVPTPAIKDALNFRVESAKKPSYAGKILSALRNQFGGHDIKSKSKKASRR